MDAGGGAGEQLSLSAVRDQLIREEDSIVFALIERAKRPRNAPAYSAAAGGGSLAEFFVREAEAVYAKASLLHFSASYPEINLTCSGGGGIMPPDRFRFSRPIPVAGSEFGLAVPSVFDRIVVQP
jgi:hypothetical protein